MPRELIVVSPLIRVNSQDAKMTRLLALLVSSLLAAQGLAEPFEKLFDVPEGESMFVICQFYMC
jgi:hypothetical protein